MSDVVEAVKKLVDDADRYWRKFDALAAAVMELDDAQRDRILVRAKELEAESHDDGDDADE